MRSKAVIKFVSGKGFFVFIDGVRDDIFFTYRDRVESLKRANRVFDNELQFAADNFKNSTYGEYLWCYTPDFLRSEDLTDLIRIRFLQQLLILESGRNKDLLVELSTYWPECFILELKAKGIVVKKNIPAYTFYFLREQIKWSYHSFIAFKRNLFFVFKKRNQPYSGILIDANESPLQHRLDNLQNLKKIPYEVKFFSGQEHRMKGFDKDMTVEFRREINSILFCKAMIKALKIGLFIKQAKKHNSSGLASYMPKVFDFRLVNLILYGMSADRYFHRSRISHLVHVSTISKPAYRVLMSIAHQNKVLFILVASRTLKILSSSERLLKCDVEAFNGTRLPDYYVLRDSFSYRIFNEFPELKQKARLGGRFTHMPEDKLILNKGIAILLMFTHVEDVCNRIIIEATKLEFDRMRIKRIFIRSHPANPIQMNRITQLANGIEIFDITGKDYSAIKEYNTICISGPTTGTLEAVFSGTTVLWIPYVWGDGILLDDLMNAVGQKCETSEEFIQKYKALLQNPSYLESEIIEAHAVALREFAAPVLISSVIKHIVE